LFGNQIILDQNWALEAIYSIFDRKKILPLLRGHGHFSRADLEALIWSGYTPEEQKVFLGMMESCGIYFKLRKLSDDDWEYIAPELLPEWSDAQEQLLGRLRDEPPISEPTPVTLFSTMGFCATIFPNSVNTQETRPFTGSMDAGFTSGQHAARS
jgi:internalin A